MDKPDKPRRTDTSLEGMLRGSRTGPDHTAAKRARSLARAKLFGAGGTGLRLGPYELVRTIGGGGMGTVYAARHVTLGYVVALKALESRRDGTPQRFKQEFRFLTDLSHLNLVQMYDLGEHDDRLYFTMELLEGVEFVHFLQLKLAAASAAPEPFDALRHGLQQIFAGLLALHSAGIVHRDIKPSNVLVTADARVVILDFGLSIGEAHLTPGDAQPSATAVHCVGTPAYMAPEQCRGQPTTAAADLYAVGVMLYEALTGRLPFLGTPSEVMVAKLQTDPAPPSTLGMNVPDDLDRLCMELLRRAPGERPSTAAIVAELEGVPQRRRTVTDGRWVERQPDLARLQDAWTASRRGFRAVCVVGEPGVGKSTLLQRFVERAARDPQAILLKARCHALDSVSYRGIDSLVDQLPDILVRSDTERLLTELPDQGPLGDLFPVLRPLLTRAPLPPVSTVHHPPTLSDARRRGLAALGTLLERLARDRPLLVWLDDAQWAGPDSITALQVLCGMQPGPALLLVLSMPAVERSTPMDDLLQSLDARKLMCQLVVQPLASASAGMLLRQRALEAGLRLDRAQQSTMLTAAAGNPLLIEQLVGLQATVHPTSGVAADCLADLVGYQFATLGPGPRRLLETVAVAALPLAADAAFALAELGDGAPACEHALRHAKLLRRDATGAFQIYHERLKAAVLAHVPQTRLITLHRRLAVHFEERADTDATTLLIHHRGSGNAAKAIGCAERLITAAFERSAFATAYDACALALQLSLGEPDRQSHLLRKQGDALACLGEGHAASEHYQRALKLAQDPTTLRHALTAWQDFQRAWPIPVRSS